LETGRGVTAIEGLLKFFEGCIGTPLSFELNIGRGDKGGSREKLKGGKGRFGSHAVFLTKAPEKELERSNKKLWNPRAGEPAGEGGGRGRSAVSGKKARHGKLKILGNGSCKHHADISGKGKEPWPGNRAIRKRLYSKGTRGKN